ncbi:MAG: methyl-accepting chemotaxis protein [Lachnospiraceae bacterium]|nr:methyl-accepting chemotaxis protein [Lachnospiraceae bacterium]
MKKNRGQSLMLKMLGSIIPFIVIAMFVLTLISAVTSRKIINEQIQDTMTSELNSNLNKIDKNLEEVRTVALSLSSAVSGAYTTTTLDQFDVTMKKILNKSDMLYGSGIWFEPNVYDASKKYAGPYWYKENGKAALTMEYSNESYDYFNQEYYKLAKELKEGETGFTEPYYDETSGLILDTCYSPIYANDKYIGCISTTITLANISDITKSIKVGDEGRALLVTGKGVYLYDKDSKKAEKNLNIADDSNKSLATASKEVLSNSKGTTSFDIDGEKYNLYYSTMPEVGWKLMIQMPQSELNAPVIRLIGLMTFVAIVATLICVFVLILIVASITKSIKSVKEFANSLASGDFTTQKISAKRKDEIGQMSGSLNEMYENNRDVISRISEGSSEVSDTSENMSRVATELSSRFDSIQSNMLQVNDAMTNTGAATEEVSASVAEVSDSINVLNDEVQNTVGQITEIKNRAEEIESSSKQAYDNAITIVETRGEEFKVARKKAEVVNEIGDLANYISEIADQITLLSLNASIEAARAGEQGRGFAVVASEISKLATETAGTVDKINETISGVQEAFASLNTNASDLLNFLQETVTPDYDKFVGIGQQYGDDAQMFENLFAQITEMVNSINRTMDEVNEAVQSIAESAQDTATSSSEVTETVNNVSSTVNEVSTMALNQETVATKLSDIVGKFKL